MTARNLSGILLPLALIGLHFTVLPAPAPGNTSDEPFDFVVFGCMPYRMPADHGRFLSLIDEVNAFGPSFSIHLGDTKSGAGPCHDEFYDQVSDYFSRFDHPLVYSIGDNEWTDCDRWDDGVYDPIERLELVRKTYFSEEKSLGARPMPLETQRRMPGFEKFVENSRWEKSGVLFVSLHVVGTNNNLRHEIPAAVREHYERDRANIVWLRDSFRLAAERGLHGVVLAIHCGPFMGNRSEPKEEGFAAFLEALEKEVLAFRRPVLMVHASTHYFRIDKPLRESATGATIEYFTRAETFGSHNMHAMRIRVTPDSRELFDIQPMIIEANRLHPLDSGR